MHVLARAAVVAAVVLLSACASAPKPQPFNREAHAGIERVAVMTQPQVEVTVMMLNHPGANFGLIGGLIAAGDMNAKENALQRTAAEAGFDPVALFRAELEAGLRERGYEPIMAEPPSAKLESGERAVEARVAGSVAAHPEADAHFQVVLGFVGYASAGAGDAQPYRPTVTAGGRLLSADGRQVLFRDMVLYHNVFNDKLSITIEPDPAYSYPDFDALEGDGARVVEGLRIAVRDAARKLAAQL